MSTEQVFALGRVVERLLIGEARNKDNWNFGRVYAFDLLAAFETRLRKTG
jgi:hypothetical protein